MKTTNYQFFPLRRDDEPISDSEIIRVQFAKQESAATYADKLLAQRPEYRKVIVAEVKFVLSRSI